MVCLSVCLSVYGIHIHHMYMADKTIVFSHYELSFSFFSSPKHSPSPFPFSSLQIFIFLSTSSSSSFSSSSFHYSVGARDYPSLSQDSFLTRWHSSRSQRRRKHYRETIKSQAASHQCRSCREVGQGVACSQVCRVFRIDTERVKECL